MLAWLCTAQLTSQLKLACNHHQFSLLSESWQSSLLPLERNLLHLDSQDLAWVRSSCHRDTGKLLVYARVTIPKPTFKAHEQDFLNLKHLPIGDTLLFNNPQVERSPFVYCLDEEQTYQRVAGLELLECDWIRSSIFTWAKQPLLLTEFFSAHLPLHPDVLQAEKIGSC